MTTSLTFNHGHAGAARWPMALMTVALFAAAIPAAACDGAPGMQVASATPGVGAFTGEFVNGAPVYRLPPINVVGHRQAEVAKTRRGEGSAPGVRSPAGSAAATPAPNRKLVTVSREASAIRPCIG